MWVGASWESKRGRGEELVSEQTPAVDERKRRDGSRRAHERVGRKTSEEERANRRRGVWRWRVSMVLIQIRMESQGRDTKRGKWWDSRDTRRRTTFSCFDEGGGEGNVKETTILTARGIERSVGRGGLVGQPAKRQAVVKSADTLSATKRSVLSI